MTIYEKLEARAAFHESKAASIREVLADLRGDMTAAARKKLPAALGTAIKTRYTANGTSNGHTRARLNDPEAAPRRKKTKTGKKGKQSSDLREVMLDILTKAGTPMSRRDLSAAVKTRTKRKYPLTGMVNYINRGDIIAHGKGVKRTFALGPAAHK